MYTKSINSQRNAIIAISLIISHIVYIHGSPIESIVKTELEKRLDDEGEMGGGITLVSTEIVGDGGFGFVVRGKTEDETPVAIKFSNGYTSVLYDREYNCYKRLGAMSDINVEKYGIPFIYHCDEFLHYKTMAMTLLDNDVLTLYKKFNGFSQRTLLIVFRDMIRTLKFIHSKGILNQDIKPDNIMIRGADVFLLDFNQADEKAAGNPPHAGSRLFRSISAHLKQSPAEYDDMQSLFYTMLLMADVKLPWASSKSDKEMLNYKLRINDVRNLCQCIKYSDLIEPFGKFYEEIIDAMMEKRLPNYDRLYHMFNDVLYKGHDQTKRIVFDWLSETEAANARKIIPPSIESIQMSSS